MCSGQRACVLPVSIIVSPQWTPVPQRTFLPWSIIQNVVLLAALALKSIEIHGGFYGSVVLKAPSCPAAAVLQWLCGPALLCNQEQNVSKRKSISRDGCGGPASVRSQPRIPTFLFTLFNSFFLLLLLLSLSWESLVCSFKTQRAFKPFSYYVPFPFCSLSNSIYGLSETSNAWETATSRLHQHLPPASLTLSFSMG